MDRHRYEREGEMAARASNEANEQEPTNSAILLAWGPAGPRLAGCY